MSMFSSTMTRRVALASMVTAVGIAVPGLLLASPAGAMPAMCGVDPGAYPAGVCPTTDSGHSSLLQASGITQHADPNSLPEVDGVPCTGMNTGKCIGLGLVSPTGG